MPHKIGFEEIHIRHLSPMTVPMGYCRCTTNYIVQISSDAKDIGCLESSIAEPRHS